MSDDDRAAADTEAARQLLAQHPGIRQRVASWPRASERLRDVLAPLLRGDDPPARKRARRRAQ